MIDQTKRLADIRAAVTDAMRSIAGAVELPLHEMTHYHLGFLDERGRVGSGGGKALRPLFCALVCEAVCGDWRRALHAAAAIELTHNFSLVHDDIEDGDRERRGRATLWARWGVAQAINAGDAVWVFAWQALARAAADGVDAEQVLCCLDRLAAACREMIEGQYLDLALEGTDNPSMEAYLRAINGKTGALLGAALEMGAICGGATAKLADRYGRAGRALGVAFQMQDDVLGTWGDPAITGKPAGNDVRRRKTSLPAVLAFAAVQDDAKARLQAIYHEREPMSDTALAEALALFEQANVRALAEQMAAQAQQEALASLAHLPMRPEAGQTLMALAQSLVGRAR